MSSDTLRLPKLAYLRPSGASPSITTTDPNDPTHFSSLSINRLSTPVNPSTIPLPPSPPHYSPTLTATPQTNLENTPEHDRYLQLLDEQATQPGSFSDSFDEFQTGAPQLDGTAFSKVSKPATPATPAAFVKEIEKSAEQLANEYRDKIMEIAKNVVDVEYAILRDCRRNEFRILVPAFGLSTACAIVFMTHTLEYLVLVIFFVLVFALHAGVIYQSRGVMKSLKALREKHGIEWKSPV
ncbi:hypothetical protein EX30DRAFT_344374 [Ascodesmis nigricans]|uniref:Uncharacterized protein n=1 Tax=Ascodesmis nigricans TaxID=341454 RepID=A0A4S2MJU3_9PEZI|nr:hypothetical protein EX30DRAFT_344374 [Ascodesmis nigricans]